MSLKLGEEQKKAFPHFKRIISKNFGQFCGVDFLMDSFYWFFQGNKIEWLTDFDSHYRNILAINWYLILVKMHVARDNFSTVKVARSS